MWNAFIHTNIRIYFSIRIWVNSLQHILDNKDRWLFLSHKGTKPPLPLTCALIMQWSQWWNCFYIPVMKTSLHHTFLLLFCNIPFLSKFQKLCHFLEVLLLLSCFQFWQHYTLKTSTVLDKSSGTRKLYKNDIFSSHFCWPCENLGCLDTG